jgi:RNA polymerase-interacting CarD/CdnL/TRCF family regulator
LNSINIRKGENVIHAQHGVGKITSIHNCSFSGHAEASYVHLYFQRDKLALTVLEENLAGVVRGLISSEEARKLLDQVITDSGEPESRWKARADANQAAIDSGNPFEYVKVLKGLAHLESEGGLRLRDREHLSQSLCLLTEELACVLKKSQRHVRGLLTKAVEVPL